MGFDYGTKDRFAASAPVGAGAVTRADTAGVSMQNPSENPPGRLTKEEIGTISKLPLERQQQIAAVATNPELTPEQIADHVRGMLAQQPGFTVQSSAAPVLATAAPAPQAEQPTQAAMAVGVTTLTTGRHANVAGPREENNYGVKAPRMECLECGTYGQFV